ncbi:DNA-binding transcriptional activator PspC [Bacteroidales bacterium Barb4]|nr:DNA-binding transcriptional activator PspC [Bacteroidales bacterium Barb4]
MKKTLTVNLGGTVFHIDEDAYELLDKYLSNLRVHFRREDSSDEIINDFEIRISELLNERIRLGYEVITVEHIEDVIKRMGRPEEIFGEEAEEAKEDCKAKADSTRASGKRRFFRHPDDRMLGGVAGGMAAYMGWDPTIVRIALILLIFFQITIPIYILLWLIVPQARTASEKLQMRGESVTVENIGKTVTDGFERMSADVNEYMHSDRPRSALQKAGDAFVSVVGFAIKALGILLCVVLIPPVLIVLFVLIVVFIALLMGLLGGGAGILYHILPYADWSVMLGNYSGTTIVLAGICCILLIGIPVFALAHAVCGQLFKWKPMAAGAKWVLLALWTLSLAASIYFAVCYGLPVWDKWGGHWNTSWYPAVWHGFIH